MGTEQRIVWSMTLMLQSGKRRPSTVEVRGCGPTMERYDFEFDLSDSAFIATWPTPTCAIRQVEPPRRAGTRSDECAAVSLVEGTAAVRELESGSRDVVGLPLAEDRFQRQRRIHFRPTEYVIVLSSRDSTSVPLDSSPMA